MKEKILKNKTLVIVVAAIVLCAIGFAAGMMVKTSLAHDSGNYIGAEKAKTIALESVGVSPAKATFTKVEIDRSERPVVYDIEFYTASNEYDFEIEAKTGNILEKSSEAITAQAPLPQAGTSNPAGSGTDAAAVTPTQQAANPSGKASSSEYIGIDKAKSIAFKHAGVSASAAKITKAKLDSDDGVKTYEIEFISGSREYEYEINAYTGKVMDYDTEVLDQYKHHNDDHDDHDDHHDYDD
ncbi:PepSY domain-containing protein [Anaerovorax odorimutans]|uniref:PepSY domain-containing protein n=1 Tax=Anaerovorax odorimutans TaxID=109327 RepID=A0ABT1RRK0_9FIRM|nr:PepSY domain-containing protein [Anaerovorax odorimutans]MCQ4637511.1 PepSY domain-containing protein [Anaerovorax odorimutans]